jgi:hypothetical protein
MLTHFYLYSSETEEKPFLELKRIIHGNLRAIVI